MSKTDQPGLGEPPLIGSAAFRDIAGISETQLRYFREMGILSPMAQNDTGPHQYYAIDQLPIGRLVNALRHSDMSVADIACVVDKGPEALIERTRLQCAEEIRSIRRRLKAITNLERAHNDFRAVGGKRGMYLRYLPERWLALIPVEGDEVAVPTADVLARAHRELERVVSVMGWSEALSYGLLLSVSADLSRASRYAFMELASPPMPVITGQRIVDGGCYSGVCPTDMQLPCYPKKCPLCARFGRLPEPGERQAWRTADRREPWRRRGTVMVDDLDAPYPDGTWARFTHEVVALRDAEEEAGARTEPFVQVVSDTMPWGPRGPRDGGAATGAGRGAGSPGPQDGDGPHGHHASVPRKMPQVVRLPLGVTACEIPAGTFLCRQFSADPGRDFVAANETTLSALLATLKTLGPASIAPCSNDACVSEWGRRGPASEPGPYVEPFAAPRGAGDPTLAGRHASLSRADLAHLGLPLGTALWPESGFCILQAVRPLDTRPTNLVREFQVLTVPDAPLTAKLRS